MWLDAHGLWCSNTRIARREELNIYQELLIRCSTLKDRNSFRNLEGFQILNENYLKCKDEKKIFLCLNVCQSKRYSNIFRINKGKDHFKCSCNLQLHLSLNLISRLIIISLLNTIIKYQIVQWNSKSCQK